MNSSVIITKNSDALLKDYLTTQKPKGLQGKNITSKLKETMINWGKSHLYQR